MNRVGMFCARHTHQEVVRFYVAVDEISARETRSVEDARS